MEIDCYKRTETAGFSLVDGDGNVLIFHVETVFIKSFLLVTLQTAF